MSDKEFPNEIDLGKKMGGGDMPSPMGAKEAKNKVYYPSLYLSDIPGLEKLPEKGEAKIYFERKGLTIRKSGAHGEQASHSVDLEITKICLPEGGGEEEDDGLDDLDRAAMKAGIDIGKKGAKKAPPAEDDEENEEENQASVTA